MIGIGATQAGACLALYEPEFAPVLTKWGNATDVWLELVHNIGRPQSAHMSRGIKVEPILREAYRRDVGPCSEPPGVVWHPAFTRARCRPDGLTATAVVELKTTSVFAASAWGEGGDEIPPQYASQCLWSCFVCDRPEAHVLAAFGRDVKDDNGEDCFAIEEMRSYRILRDVEIERRMARAVHRFLIEHVDAGVPPPMAPVNNKRVFKNLLKQQSNQGEVNG